MVDLDRADAATAQEYNVEEGIWLLRHNFVLVSEKETKELRDRNAIDALAKLGLTHLELVGHLPVPELD